MALAVKTVIEACESAKGAARTLASASTESKNEALAHLAELLEERAAEVLEANAADLAD
jgi:gamma-glutamyl phosphate reductase